MLSELFSSKPVNAHLLSLCLPTIKTILCVPKNLILPLLLNVSVETVFTEHETARDSFTSHLDLMSVPVTR